MLPQNTIEEPEPEEEECEAGVVQQSIAYCCSLKL